MLSNIILSVLISTSSPIDSNVESHDAAVSNAESIVQEKISRGKKGIRIESSVGVEKTSRGKKGIRISNSVDVEKTLRGKKRIRI